MIRAGRYAAALISAMAVAAMCGSEVFAAANAFGLDDVNWTDEDWNSVAMANDDTVTTGALIRSDADTDSEVVGYLYRGGAGKVLEKGDNWTLIESGSVTGYVMNDYLVYGEEVQALAEYYGEQGVVAKWDDVNVFSDADADASVSGTVDSGSSLTVASDEGHWLTVQVGADSAGYVSEEDVARMLLVDTAVPVDGEDIEGAVSVSQSTKEAVESGRSVSEAAGSTAAEEPAYTEDTSVQ